MSSSKQLPIPGLELPPLPARRVKSRRRADLERRIAKLELDVTLLSLQLEKSHG